MEVKFRVVNNMEDRFLLVEDITPEQTFEEEMLLNNDIPGLLSMETGGMSGTKYHRFRVTGMKNLGEYLNGKQLSGEQFESFFTHVFEIIHNARDYFLREDGFWISPDSLYVDEQTGKLFLCYIPEYHEPLADQMKALSVWFLSYIDVSDASAIVDGYGFHVLCHGGDCNFGNIAALLEENRKEIPVVTSYDESKDITENPLESKHRGWRLARAWFVSLLFVSGIGMVLLWALR